MKKIILIAAMAVSSIATYAQASIGGQIGANLGMGHSGSSLGSPVSSDPKVGLLVGVLADVEIVDKISLRPEFNFIQKGSKSGGYLGSAGTYTFKRTLNYLELPVNVVYKLSPGESPNKLYFGLGPTFGLGLFGKDKNPDGSKFDVKFDGDDNATGSNVHFKRIDVGLNVLAGYELKSGFFGKIGYTLGFADLDVSKNNSYKNRGISICVGYMIGNNGKKK